MIKSVCLQVFNNIKPESKRVFWKKIKKNMISWKSDFSSIFEYTIFSKPLQTHNPKMFLSIYFV